MPRLAVWMDDTWPLTASSSFNCRVDVLFYWVICRHALYRWVCRLWRLHRATQLQRFSVTKLLKSCIQSPEDSLLDLQLKDVPFFLKTWKIWWILNCLLLRVEASAVGVGIVGKLHSLSPWGSIHIGRVKSDMHANWWSQIQRALSKYDSRRSYFVGKRAISASNCLKVAWQPMTMNRDTR